MRGGPLDHMGYPDIAASPAQAGKLSDAGEQAIDFLQPVVDAFGAERIAWGSNCPAAEQSLPELLELGKNVLEVLPARPGACIRVWTQHRTDRST
jgi:L-fuconolactonase